MKKISKVLITVMLVNVIFSALMTNTFAYEKKYYNYDSKGGFVVDMESLTALDFCYADAEKTKAFLSTEEVQGRGNTLKLTAVDVGDGIKQSMAYYYFTEGVTTGKYVYGFDANLSSSNGRIEVYMNDPSTGSVLCPFSIKNGSIYQGFKTEIITEAYIPGSWNRFDFVMELNGNTDVYIDGVYTATVNTGCSAANWMGIYFNSSVENDYTLIDNVTFVPYGNEDKASIKQNDDGSLTVLLSEPTLGLSKSNIKLFDLGTNPLNPAYTEVSYTLNYSDFKTAIITPAAVEKGHTYKVSLGENVASSFGNPVNDGDLTVYIPVGESANDISIKDVSHLDSNGTIYNWFWQNKETPVEPYSYTRIDEGNESHAGLKLSQTPTEGIFDIKFDMTITQNSAGGDSSIISMKAADGTFFTFASLSGSSLQWIVANEDYATAGRWNDHKMTYESGDTITVELKLNIDTHKASLKVDGKEVYTDKYLWYQDRASTYTTSMENIEYLYFKTKKSNVSLSNVSFKNTIPVTSVNSVKFVDIEGNATIVGSVSSATDYIKIIFTGPIDAKTVNVSMVDSTSNSITFDYTYDEDNYVYTVKPNCYFTGGETYTMTVSDVVTTAGGAVETVSGTFIVLPSVFSVSNLAMEKADAAVTLSADYINTKGLDDTVYMVYAAYNGNLLTDIDFYEANCERGKKSGKISKTFTMKTTNYDTVKGFILKDLNKLIPLTRALTK